MEMSHRGPEFISIAAEAESDLRELLAIPANYKVLFLQGGATLQFAQVPMNLLRGKGKADYVLTGEWSKKAVKEAKNYCDVAIAASPKTATSPTRPSSGRSGKTRRTSITARTRPSGASSFTKFQEPNFRSSPTPRRTSCRARSTCRNSA